MKEEEKEKKEKTEIIYPFDDERFLKAWEVWKQYKKEQFSFEYKPMGEQAALKLISELSENDVNKAAKIILQSIENGWKGFFKLKNNHETRIEPTEQSVSSIVDNYFAGKTN